MPCGSPSYIIFSLTNHSVSGSLKADSHHFETRHTMNPTPAVYLASNSPRRREILQNLGYAVRNIAVETDETPHAGEAAADYVLRLARAKNQAARAAHPEAADCAIVSADTAVVLDGAILGKPADAAHAAAMLRALSGRTHQVLTAVCVSFRGHTHALVQQNDVGFRQLDDAEIAAYLATGEPLDKAGAYGIQGIGGVFVRHLSGSFTGVMGLPVFETVELLHRCGARVPPFQAA